MPYLVRNGNVIEGVEFANVVGRAGRAFVDVEGLVLHVIKEKVQQRERQWQRLVDTSRERELTSGLFLVIDEAFAKLSAHGILDRKDAYEYLANHQDAWVPVDADEKETQSIDTVLDKLDNIVLGLIKALDAEPSDLPALLDEALQGALWKRQVERSGEHLKTTHLSILAARAKLIWNETSSSARKGYFAMGLGLASGQSIDAIATELELLLDGADLAASDGDADKLVKNLTELARNLFQIDPFAPEKLHFEWESLLELWILGKDIEEIGASNMHFIEDAFCYRLVWALEAVRVRRISAGWEPEAQAGAASAAIENGLPDVRMSMLVRAGLPSRKAAILAVREGEPNFNNHSEIQGWLYSKKIEELSSIEDWPTPETAAIWQDFRQSASNQLIPLWNKNTSPQQINSKTLIPVGMYRVTVEASGKAWLTTADFQPIAPFARNLFERWPGILHAKIEKEGEKPIVTRFGPGSWTWK